MSQDHTHPGPMVTGVPGAPFMADHDADMSLAAALIAARLADCEPCQKKLSARVLKGDQLVLAGLAASLPPMPPHDIREGTSTIYPVLRSRSGSMILGIIGAMPRPARADLLADAVDYWVAKMPLEETGTPEQADASSVVIDLPAPAGPEEFPNGIVEFRRMPRSDAPLAPAQR